MSQGQFYLIRENKNTESVLGSVLSSLRDRDDFPLTLRLEKYEDLRSQGQLALVHIWFRELAKSFTDRGSAVDPERMKLLLKHKFLGTEDVLVGKTEIPGQVRPLPTKKGELHQFMNQVEAWASDHGCFLSMPGDSEYMKYKEAQIK